MNYRLDNRKKKRTHGYLIFAALMIVILILPVSRGVFDLVEKPLLQAWQWTYGEERISNLELLEKEKERMRIDLLRLEYLEEELDTLITLRDQYPQAKRAQVIKRIGEHEMILNQTSPLEYRVFAEDHFLLGKVVAVGDLSTRVSLFSQPGTIVPVVINGQSLDIIGAGGSQYMIQAPRDLELELNDVAYSQEYPGAIVAVIAHIAFDPRDPFKQVFLRMPYNPKQVQNVALLPSI